MRRSLRIVWQRALRRLGWFGLCGVGLLLLSAAGAALLPVLSRDTQDLARRVAQARTRVEVQTRSTEAAATPASERMTIAELTASLPSLAQNASDLEKLFELAFAHKVVLNKADYQWLNEPRAPLATYSVTLPVRQSYAVIKQFSAEVLRALPHVALDELRLERNEAGIAELEARLRFTFIYRGL